jgi:hypothetical protein
MGGKRSNRSRSKKSRTRTAVQKAAAARHAKFKQTRVQTFGGKKTSFSKKEEARIKKAGYSVAGYSKAAPNKASGYSGTSGVSVGSKIKNPNPKTTGIGPVKSGDTYAKSLSTATNQPTKKTTGIGPYADGAKYAAALKASPPRFQEAGRNEVNQNIATNYNDLGSGLQNILQNQYKAFDKQGLGEKELKRLQNMYPGFTPRAGITDGTLTATHDNRLFKSVPATGPSADVLAGPEFKRLYNVDGGLIKGGDLFNKNNSIGIPLASTAPISTLGIQTAAGGSEAGFDRDSFNRALEGNYDPDSAGGLNIGGNFGLSAAESDRLSRAIKPTGNPDVMSPDGTFNRPGPGGPEPEADYTSYQPGSFYNQSDTNMNPTNFLRSARNVITTPARMLGINNQFTNMLIPKSNEAIQDGIDQRGPRPTLTRRRGGGGGARLPVTPTVIEEIIPEALPVPSASTTPATQTGIDPNRLLQIQQQAYAQAYNPMLIGGFNPQFRFGAATPTIDYSTYFNY